MARGVLVEMFASGFMDSSGNPLANGKVHSYTAGTTTRKDLYTAYTLAAAAANPVILDEYGRATVFGNGVYKFIVKDQYDTTITTLDGCIYQESSQTIYSGGTVGGSANAITLSNTISLSSLSSGSRFLFIAAASNTTSTTLNVDGLGAKSM